MDDNDPLKKHLSVAKIAESPLRGVRIVEMSAQGPGPYAALLLAEYGADVVRRGRG
jgi:alpha-methylacyl-CoA racemase